MNLEVSKHARQMKTSKQVSEHDSDQILITYSELLLNDVLHRFGEEDTNWR